MTHVPQAAGSHRLAVPKPVAEQHWDAAHEPLVTIRCITYNHAPFIRDAIESFLRQETTFPVEILIHDDASTDGTTEILRAYVARYPQLIRILVQPENTYRKPNRFAYRQELFKQARGKYVAFCDGDDYWQDPRKLQIQADYLDEHPGMVMSGHDAVIVQADGTVTAESHLPRGCRRDLTAGELQRGVAWLPTSSWMVRREPLDEDMPEHSHVLNGDTFRRAVLGRYGGSHFHAEIAASAYRVHPGGVWSGRTQKEKQLALANTAYWISEYFHRVGDHAAASCWATRYMRNVVAVSPTSILVRALISRSPIGRLTRGLRARLS